MKRTKTSRRALLMSVLSMLMCCAMLVGSTFAWFTDSVTSAENKIVAGVLDVKMYYDNLAGASTANWWVNPTEVTGETELFKTIYDDDHKYKTADIKWEPGVVVVENFYICNKGDVALEYKFTLDAQPVNYVEVDGELKSLADVLKVAVVPGSYVLPSASNMSTYMASAVWENLSDFSFSNHLIPDPSGADSTIDYDDATRTFAVLLYWEPSANDDDYNLKNGKKAVNAEKEPVEEGLSIDVGVNLFATQYTYEHDSRGNTYDRGVLDNMTGAEALKNGDKAAMNVNVAFPNAIEEQIADYNAMSVKIESAALTAPIVAHLGSDGYFTADEAYVDGAEIAFDSINIGSGSYNGYKFALNLPKDQTYTLTFTGAGYRQYRTTVKLTDDATVNVWNNAMGSEQAVVTVGAEEVTKATITFLAGDIDNSGKIDSKDQTEVSNRFGTTLDTSKADSRVKYDLNRDGKIDSGDTSRILTSWGK